MSNILTNNINPRSGNKITIGGVNDTVSIAGTVTYEDVTSVDSVGVITARQGVVIGTGASIGNPANNELGLYTNSSERVRIDSSGRIGIGTNAPSSLLEMREGTGDAIVTIHAAQDDSGADAQLILETSNDFAESGTLYKDSTGLAGGIRYNHGDNAIRFSGKGIDAEMARLDSSGRLLVGTSSDSGVGLLIIQGYPGSSTGEGIVSLQKGAATPASGDSLGVINFANNGANNAAQVYAQRDGGTWTSGSSHPGRLVFSTTADGAGSPTERMRIDRDGKVHIGDDLGDRQAELLQVIRNGGGQGTNDCLVWFETGQNDWIMSLNHTELASGNAYFINCLQQGTQRGKAWFNNGSMLWATDSDYRLKENITPVTNAISDVKRLNPVNFNFIEFPEHPQVGFIAHELDEVCPYAVGGEKDAVKEDGSIDAQSIDKSYVVPLLTAALQEAIAKIETLEAQVAELQGN